MVWPESWAAIENPSEARVFEEELAREVTPEHPLFGVPIRAIGREMGGPDVLFALEDSSGRLAQVLLLWQGHPDEELAPHFPGTFFCGSFEGWVREREQARAFARLKPDLSIVPRWNVGDRVLMRAHSDFRADARATIIREGRPRLIFDGSTHIEYAIQFDEPQPDGTSDDHGRPNKWEGTSVLEEYIRPLDPNEEGRTCER